MVTWRYTGLIAAAMLALSLTGCGSDSYFGGGEEPPLPGKRISILVHQQNLAPDPSASKQTILLPAPTTNANWPQAGGYANHAMHHIKVGDNIQEAWSVDIGRGNSDQDRLISQPVVAGGLIFAMDSASVVTAYNAKTGNDVWEVELTPEDEDDGHIGGGLAFEGGRIFATTGFGQVIAIDARSGKIAWRRKVGLPIRTAPTVRDNRVFVVTATNTLFALNARNGETLWQHSGIEETTNLLGGGSPAVDGGVVIVPYSSGELAALKVENGQELWTDSLAGGRRSAGTTTISAIRGRPIIDRGLVFAISNGGLVAAINLRTGRRVWDRTIGGVESPWIAGDYLFVISNNSELVALGRRTGRIHWVRPLPQWEDPEDKDGRIIWTGPILVSDRLIVAGSSGEAMSISPYSGRILGKVEMPDGVTISPIVAQNTIFFLSDDAELVAYR